MQEYKYEVAFSFLKEDEDLALKLNDLIQERVSTFLYSKRQEEIAGTNGEETFNKVFGEESRIVVILYRNNWGNTPWTRIEETAIRNRGYEEGYDFTVFIPLEKPPQVPKWLPKTQIWANLERYGIEGAANIIETKIQQAGGITREESLEEHAERIKRQIDMRKAKEKFLGSKHGVKAANEEFTNLATRIDTITKNISSESDLSIAVKTMIDNGVFWWIEAYDARFCIVAEWLSHCTNTLRGSRLDITLLQGRPRRPNRITMHEPKMLLHFLFNFDINESGIYGWRRADDSSIMSTNQMAEFCINTLINRIHKDELGNRA